MNYTNLNQKKDVIKIVKKTKLIEHFFILNLYEVQHALFEGGFSDKLNRVILERGHAVGLLPYDPEQDSVLLIEQFRLGAHVANLPPWQLEIIAGMIDENEIPEDAIKRESLEESNLEVNQLREITKYLSTSGGSSETMQLYCSKFLSSDILIKFSGLKTENEDIKIHIVPREEAFKMVEEGIIQNAAAIIALQWLELNYQALKKEWYVLNAE